MDYVPTTSTGMFGPAATTLTPTEIQQLSQSIYDPKSKDDVDITEIVSEGLTVGDIADSGDLALDLYEGLDASALSAPGYSGASVSTTPTNMIGSLTSGTTTSQAERIWKVYDRDNSGSLDRCELRRLVHDLGNAIIRRLSTKIERISKQMSNPDAAAEALFKAFDTSRDGVVQKDEFMALAMRGLHNIPTVTDHHDADHAGPGTKSGTKRGQPDSPSVREERKLKSARRGQPGFEMVHLMMLRVANLKAGLKNLSTGVSAAEAEVLWKTFDANGDGKLDKSEVQALFAEQATMAIQGIYSRIASYADAMSRSSTVDELLDKFDADGDGKVQKHEFIALAVKGVKIRLPQKAETDK